VYSSVPETHAASALRDRRFFFRLSDSVDVNSNRVRLCASLVVDSGVLP
jgi:hypothetical protein